MNLISAQREVMHSSLKSTEKLVLLALLDHWSKTNQEVYPSVARIGALTSLGRATVMRALQALAELRVIEAIRRPAGAPTVWRIDLSELTRVSHHETPPVSPRDTPCLTVIQGLSQRETPLETGGVSERDGGCLRERRGVYHSDTGGVSERDTEVTNEVTNEVIQGSDPLLVGSDSGRALESLDSPDSEPETQPPSEPQPEPPSQSAENGPLTPDCPGGATQLATDSKTPSEADSGPVIEAPKKRTRRKGLWHFVPEDWAPSEKHRDLAARLQVELETEVSKFRDHEFAVARSDPDRAFSNWLRNAAKRSNYSRKPLSQSGIRAGWTPKVFTGNLEGGKCRE